MARNIYLKGKIMEDIICPKCGNVVSPGDDWSFIDFEEHEINCPCGFQFTVIIERPIEYYILEK